MTLKEQISSDFITAFKNKDNVSKSALSFLKAKITDAEKNPNNKNSELGDDDVLKVVLSSIKQRKDSIEQFKKANRLDLVEKEEFELNVISKYLPKQFSSIELKEKVTELMTTIVLDVNNRNKNIGMLMGIMNKTYKGMFDVNDLKLILEVLI